MSSRWFSPILGTQEKPLAIWTLLVAGILAWTVVGVFLTAVAYLLWPEPREIWQEYIASFSAFIPLFIFLLVTPKIVGRPVLTAITGSARIRWRLVALGTCSWGLLLVFETLIKWVRNPDSVQFVFPGVAYLWPLLVSLVLLPIQTVSEELLFRGAIPHTLTTIIRNPWVVVVVSGVMFGLAHLSNPEAQRQPWIALIGYSVTGVGWGLATYKSAGLELVIGAHTINNFYGLLIVGYANSAVMGSAIWTTPAVDMVESTVLNLIMMVIWLLFLRKTFRAATTNSSEAMSSAA